MRVSLKLTSSLESVDKIERTAEEFATLAGFDEDTVPNIAMAVREAAVNAILHGNAYNPAKNITATFEANSDALIVRIADERSRPTRRGKYPPRFRPRHLPHQSVHG